MCEFLFLPCRGLAASSGLGSLPQCAAIVWLCGPPLPIAKLFRRGPLPSHSFSCLRVFEHLSLLSQLSLYHIVSFHHARVFPPGLVIFSVSFMYSLVSVFSFSLSHCFLAFLVPPILAFLPLELFDLIALACLFPSTKQTHELLADCANTLLFLSRAV